MCPTKAEYYKYSSLTANVILEPCLRGATPGPVPTTSDTQSEKIRYGAPDGPRQKERENFDRREPIIYAGHEAVAQFLATPESEREFGSVPELAKHFGVTPKTIYAWMKDGDVLRRADWLAMRNKLKGDLIARCAWPQIVDVGLQEAMKGNVQAIKFLAMRAWPEDFRKEHSHEAAELTIEELIDLTEKEQGEIPTWKQREIREEEERAAANNSSCVLVKQKDPPK